MKLSKDAESQIKDTLNQTVDGPIAQLVRAGDS